MSNETDNLPVGPELDARVLVSLGWRWMRDRKRGLCSLWPPDDRRGTWRQWHADNWGPDTHEPVIGCPPVDQRYDDWEYGSCSKRRQRRPGWHAETVRSGIPFPSTRWDDAGDVLAELHRRGTTEAIYYDRDTELYRVELDMGSAVFRASAPTMPLALCLACADMDGGYTRRGREVQ